MRDKHRNEQERGKMEVEETSDGGNRKIEREERYEENIMGREQERV